MNRAAPEATARRTAAAAAGASFDTVAWRKRHRARRKRAATELETFEDHVATAGQKVRALDANTASNVPIDRALRRVEAAQRALEIAAASLRREIGAIKSTQREWCSNFATETQRTFDPLFAGLGLDAPVDSNPEATTTQQQRAAAARRRANADLTTAIWKRGGPKKRKQPAAKRKPAAPAQKRRKTAATTNDK